MIKKELALSENDFLKSFCEMPGGEEIEEGKVFFPSTCFLFKWHTGFMLELASGLWGGWLHTLHKQHADMLHNNVATRLTSRSSSHECIPVSQISYVLLLMEKLWPTSWQLGEQKSFYWMGYSWYLSHQLVPSTISRTATWSGVFNSFDHESSNISPHHSDIDVFMWNSSKPCKKGKSLVSGIVTYTHLLCR